MNSNTRNQHIDLLRGLAISLVLILHFHLSYHLDQSAFTKIFSANFINAFASNGNYGVTMFFVISGFLITSKSLVRYCELGKIDIIGFYVFRLARIMPCLLLVLTVILLFNFANISIFQNTTNTISLAYAFLSIMTFWHNVLMGKVGYFNYCLNIYWSLSVEEVFYVAFPFLCLLLKKPRFMVFVWIVLIIFGPIYRSFYVDNEIISLYAYFSCFDGIAAGCCLAVIMNNRQFGKWLESRNTWLINTIRCGAWSTLVATYLYGISGNVVFGITLVALSTAVLIMLGENIGKKVKIGGNIFKQIICWLGKDSYEIYLFHIVVLALMKTMVGSDALGNYSKLLWMAVYLAASLSISGVIAKFYSQPMNTKIRWLLLKVRLQR